MCVEYSMVNVCYGTPDFYVLPKLVNRFFKQERKTVHCNQDFVRASREEFCCQLDFCEFLREYGEQGTKVVGALFWRFVDNILVYNSMSGVCYILS